MAKKRKRQKTVSQRNKKSSAWQPNNWMIVALIVFFFAAGVMVKVVFVPSVENKPVRPNIQSNSFNNSALESKVQLVAANFRCACGGCGELFLIDCTCDMPEGAVEEKSFIRDQLQQGLNVDQVIELVDKKYGHRII
jgi:cytochrome c-type biogenesis protein CcmH/NrfF